MSVPNFSFIACLEVAQKFIVGLVVGDFKRFQWILRVFEGSKGFLKDFNRF